MRFSWLRTSWSPILGVTTLPQLHRRWHSVSSLQWASLSMSDPSVHCYSYSLRPAAGEALGT